MPRPDVTVPLCAADKLSRSPEGRRRSGAVDRYLTARPKALEFVEEWLRKRADGTTDWSLSEVENELRAEHGWDFAPRSLRGWVDRHRAELWRR